MDIADQINEEILLTLYEDDISQRIQVGIKTIEKPLEAIKQMLFQQLDSELTTLESIMAFIGNRKELEQIEKYYAYCSYLDSSYQGFTASNKAAIAELEKAVARISLNKKSAEADYDPLSDITAAKASLKADYKKWFHAFEIHRAYRECNDDGKILSFSHRICGWSDPVYQLTSNFSLELKTNFGYGRSSYFYTKLTYKNVEITPISEWVRYEYAEFMEIVRYSKKHSLIHKAWLEAMEYTKAACNLSRMDENAFVEKYIINECKQMVEGLVHALHHKKFELLNAWHQPVFVNKEGHVLMEYRGEKISGALDFIQKILEFEHITAVQNFIVTIKDCNKQLQPMLADELILLEGKIIKASEDRSAYEPIYDDANAQNKEYDKAREELKKELIQAEEMTWKAIDYNLLNVAFNERFKEYDEFIKLHKTVIEKWLQLNQHLSNLKNFRKNINAYHSKITDFFKDRVQ